MGFPDGSVRKESPAMQEAQETRIPTPWAGRSSQRKIAAHSVITCRNPGTRGVQGSGLQSGVASDMTEHNNSISAGHGEKLVGE